MNIFLPLLLLVEHIGSAYGESDGVMEHNPGPRQNLRGAKSPHNGDKRQLEPIDEALGNSSPRERQLGGRRLSGRVIIMRKTAEELRGNGKTEEEINAIRQKGMSVIKRNKIVSESKGLDFQVVEVGQGLEKQFIEHEMNGPNAELFQFMEPDYLEVLDYQPDDTRLSNQWHHDNMESRLAWNTTFGSQDVVVAICDTGIDKYHEDLQDNMVEGYNAVDQKWESEGGDVTYVHSHGTRCAGCAAAIGDNGKGVVGVGGNLKHRPMRVTNDASGNAYSSTLAHCMETACNAGDKAVSVSYSGVESIIRDQAATLCKSLGSLAFNSAGNDNRDITGYNADANALIVVGATDSNDAKSSFSAHGSFVDVMAPGSGIYTTTAINGYTSTSGTSFSCPLTAGLAALIWSANPSLSPDDVEQVIKESADDLGPPGYDNTFAYGRINSYRAMQHPLVAVAAAPSTTVSASPSSTASTSTSASPGTSTTSAAIVSCKESTSPTDCNTVNGCGWWGKNKVCCCDQPDNCIDECAPPATTSTATSTASTSPSMSTTSAAVVNCESSMSPPSCNAVTGCGWWGKNSVCCCEQTVNCNDDDVCE